MRWNVAYLASSLRHLLSGLCNKVNANDLEEIRQVLLDEIDIQVVGRNDSLKRRIQDARDLQDLWYTRGDIMALLAITEGEACAKQRMVYISNLFKGLLPKGLTSRPSPLGH